jgi:hypothetical protein
LISPLEQLPKQLPTATIAVGHAADFGQELVGQNRDVGRWMSGRGEDVDHLIRCDRRETIWRIACVEIFVGLATRIRPRPVFAMRPHAIVWKNATSSRIASASGWVADSAKAFESSRHSLRTPSERRPLLPDVLHERRQDHESRSVPDRSPALGIVEAVEEPEDDLVLLQQHFQGLVDRDAGVFPGRPACRPRVPF